MAVSPRNPKRSATTRASQAPFVVPGLVVVLVMAAVSACNGTPGGPPSPPDSVVATAIPGAVRVSWTDTSDDELGFLIYRETLAPAGLTNQAFTQIARTGANVTSYDDVGVEADAEYIYQVAATGPGGTSAAAPATGTPPAGPLPGVDLRITFDGTGTVSVGGPDGTRQCIDDCTLPFAVGAEVTLDAHGGGGLTFAGWSGACGEAGTCTLTLTEATEVTARFRTHVLTVRLLGDAAIEADVSPSETGTGITICDLARGEACAVAYASPLTASVNVTLQEPGAVLDGIAGCDTTGPVSYCLIAVNGDSPIDVTAVRAPDALSDGPYGTDEDVAMNVTAAAGVLANDIDSADDQLRAVLVVAPTHGTLDLRDDGGFSYTPAADYAGSDAFSYHAVDTYGNVSDTVAAQILVAAVNDAPVGTEQSLYTPEDTPVPVTLSATDVENDPVEFAVATDPSHGTLSGDAPELTYTPDDNFNGTDSFTFTASDGESTSEPATVTIQVGAIADAPVAVSDDYDATEDTTLVVAAADGVLANDVDAEGDIVAAELVSEPTHGTLDLDADGGFSYAPDENFDGSDEFTYRAVDAAANASAPTAVTIDVAPINDAPVAVAGSSTVTEDTPEQLTMSATDVDADTLTYAIVTGPTHGTLSAGTGATRTYTPTANYNGPDSFTFRANDGQTNSNTATFTITVTAVNDAPVANGQALVTAMDTPLGITLTGSDVDGDALTFTVTLPPTNGALSGTAPDLVYTPAAGFTGADSFAFTVSDTTLTSPAATVSIDVQ